jgi:hypothetical protein
MLYSYFGLFAPEKGFPETEPELEPEHADDVQVECNPLYIEGLLSPACACRAAMLFNIAA